tara:strand:- start:21 stop:356 length:336 start_codon:yes stop_codon:yes gene_type:complete
MNDRNKFEGWWDNYKQYELDSTTLALLQFHFPYEIYILPCEYQDAITIRFDPNGEKVEYNKLKRILGGKAIEVKKRTITYGNKEDSETTYTIFLNPKWVKQMELGKWNEKI